MSGRRIVLASGNPGKIREIAELFVELDLEIVAQSEFGIESPEETGETFVENALQKALHAANQSGLPAIADDSGIAVDALDGRPGVRSARYAGDDASDDDNLDKLIEEMKAVPAERRGAGFHCAAVLAFPDDDQDPIIAEGVWRGTLLDERRGAGGFGYDPIFLDTVAGKTGAEMTRAEKNGVSHRGQAFRQLKDLLRALLADA